MYELKVGEILHGFRLVRQKELPALDGVLYEFCFEKNGARLAFLARGDENKTFSVAFRTIPEDSTGVFHIIEHSVLCGSEKYPVKEPFVELLKGSLQTFLNAMTYPDRTVYPISTRNSKDFFNLTEVYLDAVFNPLMKTKRAIFLQEGTRRELGADGGLSYNGVVYNEMKGAYSSPDELSAQLSDSMLFGEGSFYAHDSGGNPEEIVKLSYEEFLAAHEKYYHPSNAYFFLDGEVELDATLKLIASYIEGYERVDSELSLPAVAESFEAYREAEYEISEGESERDKARLCLNYLATDCGNIYDSLGLDVVFGAINNGSDSPLQRAIMESELCEQFDVYLSGERRYATILADFQNVKDGREAELKALFLSTLSEIVKGGVSRDALEASINSMEFLNREQNTYGFPIGVLYALNAYSAWIWGEAPELGLDVSHCFPELRSRISSGYYEELLERYILNNERSTTLVMRPSASLGERRRRAEEEKLSSELASLSEDELLAISASKRELDAYQLHIDTEEELATLPTLSVADISEEVSEVPTELSRISGVELIKHRMPCRGISYSEMFFDASDTEELYVLRLLSLMLPSSGTDELDAYGFECEKRRELGTVSLVPSVLRRGDELKLYLKLSVSVLDGRRESFLDILPRLALSTTLDDKITLRNFIMQSKLSLESSFTSGGDGIGFTRCLAYSDGAALIKDKLSGYEFYLETVRLEESFDELADELIAKMRALRDKIFTRPRLTLALTGDACDELAEKIISIFPRAECTASNVSISALGALGEGFAIPARVGFAVLAGKLDKFTPEERSAISVAKGILNYEYLWSEVRVKGGAYGVRLRAMNDGSVGFSSYRDPSPEHSLEVFRGAADFLRAFAEREPDLTKYIIGAVGEMEPYSAEPHRASVATLSYLIGETHAVQLAKKRAMLRADKSALLLAADIIEKCISASAEMLIAPRETVEKVNPKRIITV